MALDNPLNQLPTLAGQLARIPPEAQGAPVSPGAESLPDEKLTFLVQQPVTAPAAISVSAAQASSPITPEPDHLHTAAVAQELDPAGREPALRVVPTVSQGHPPQYRTPRCPTTAPTVTYISLTTSFKESKMAAHSFTQFLE
ncbi:zinc finger protein Pegasus-like [Carassius carassius]|uniref:zinc finger protein Pegasus-like n=1 Tax=Carassius carassius TaxID=217509 RepID=UPI0028692FB6|nr:zinc finger protein Pegasus-like [Carassius carassius]